MGQCFWPNRCRPACRRNWSIQLHDPHHILVRCICAWRLDTSNFYNTSRGICHPYWLHKRSVCGFGQRSGSADFGHQTNWNSKWSQLVHVRGRGINWYPNCWNLDTTRYGRILVHAAFRGRGDAHKHISVCPVTHCPSWLKLEVDLAYYGKKKE
jgi:hypothetical protein